ncbi:uncharacterized protein LOC130724525 [Lotus japonicus]|uniref:uncharacterized protein LOC130724525 n=1 Tax=Lotus japonicus TaxID=34305 RepID=UPI00258D0DA6|nr:uncharacterized protein LOC130724525 [Lotus japonicus]
MASPSLQQTHRDWLALTLSPPSPTHSPPPPNPFFFEFIPLPQPPQNPLLFEIMYPPFNQEHKRDSPSEDSSSGEAPPSKKTRRKKKKKNPPPKTENTTIPPPFPWATTKRAVIHTLDHLRSHRITTITGTVACKRCHEETSIAFNLEEKFNEVAHFIEHNKCVLHDRAPESWSSPVLPPCSRCGTENSLKPVITKKRSINWLFLLLGQWIGCCNRLHLKYFLKHATDHRTGAKDRLVYAVYLGLWKQLQPQEPFDYNA